jgi:hypothetical protein
MLNRDKKKLIILMRNPQIYVLKVVVISGEYKTVSRVCILKYPNICLEKLNSVNKNAEISK